MRSPPYTPVHVRLSKDLIDRCLDFGSMQVQAYAKGKSTIYTIGDAEKVRGIQADAKGAEVAAALALGLEPGNAVDFNVSVRVADPGYDLLSSGRRIDVKSADSHHKTFILRNVKKNKVSVNADVFLYVTGNLRDNDFVAHCWIATADWASIANTAFASKPKGLIQGTRYVDINDPRNWPWLHDIRDLNDA